MTDLAPAHPSPLRISRLHRGFATALLGLLVACGAGGGVTSGGGGDGGGGGGGGPGGGGGGGGGNNGGTPLPVKPFLLATNTAALDRTETLRGTVPFTRGQVRDVAQLQTLGVRGYDTAWLPLQYWPDGSIRTAQAQWTVALAPSETLRFEVGQDVTALTAPFSRHPWVTRAARDLWFGARVTDTFGVVYESTVQAPGRVVQETTLTRVSHHRVYHQATGSGGIGRDYLASQFYITEFRDQPIVLVDWILGNDYLGSDSPDGSADPNLYPLGGVDVNRAEFVVRGGTETRPYLGGKHAVQPGRDVGNGWRGYVVMENDFLGDAQTRRYRFLVRVEDSGASAEDKQRWRSTFNAQADDAVYPLAEIQVWQGSHALGLQGGPVDGPANAASRANGMYNSWEGANHFGTWGTFGDVKLSGTTGTPRNTAGSEELFRAIQSGDRRLLKMLEQKAWAQSQRDCHTYGLRVGAEERILLWDMPPIYPGSRDLSHESLGRRALWRNDPYTRYRTRVQLNSQRAHGWNPYDSEHWTTDLLFDYWSVSGDAWAKDELVQMGECLKGLFRLATYNTRWLQAVRAEGWAMQGFVQVFMATQDPAMKAYAVRRLNEVIEAQREKTHPSKMLTFQGTYAGTLFPGQHEFYMPWQHGPVLFGLLAAYEFFEAPIALRICEDVVTAVEYAWVTNYTDPVTHQVVPQGLRYYCPISHDGNPVPANIWDQDPNIRARWGDSPLGGAHIFLIGGLHRLAALTENATVREKALHYGGILLGQMDDDRRWSKWTFMIPQHVPAP